MEITFLWTVVLFGIPTWSQLLRNARILDILTMILSLISSYATRNQFPRSVILVMPSITSLDTTQSNLTIMEWMIFWSSNKQDLISSTDTWYSPQDLLQMALILLISTLLTLSLWLSKAKKTELMRLLWVKVLVLNFLSNIWVFHKKRKKSLVLMNTSLLSIFLLRCNEIRKVTI